MKCFSICFVLVVWFSVFCTFSSMAQDASDQPLLIGRTSFRSLSARPYFDWFGSGYDGYQPNPSAIEFIKSRSSGIRVLIFGATWCSDTRANLPSFIKVLDLSGIQRKRVDLYFTDRDKHTPEGLENQYGIMRVPTFIVLRNGLELGRITESASTTLEGDLADILSK